MGYDADKLAKIIEPKLEKFTLEGQEFTIDGKEMVVMTRRQYEYIMESIVETIKKYLDSRGKDGD